jgi:hypothetical protein
MFFSRFFRRMGEFYSKIEQWARTSEPAVGADVPEVVDKDMFEFVERQKALCQKGQIIFAINEGTGFRSGNPPELLTHTPFGTFGHTVQRHTDGRWYIIQLRNRSFLSVANSRAIDQHLAQHVLISIVNE